MGCLRFRPTTACASREPPCPSPPHWQAAGLSVLVYNGDADACVPATDNEWWTASMNYSVAQPWHAWLASDGTLGGYVTEYAPPRGKVRGRWEGR